MLCVHLIIKVNKRLILFWFNLLPAWFPLVWESPKKILGIKLNLSAQILYLLLGVQSPLNGTHLRAVVEVPF